MKVFLGVESSHAMALPATAPPEIAPLVFEPPIQCYAPPSGMVSWWAAENNAGDNLNRNNGVLQGNAGFIAGEVGDAFNFDGTGDFVQVAAPNSLPVGNAARTVELWFRAPATPGESGLFQYGSASNGNMFGLITSGNAPGRLYFYGHNADLAANTVIQANTWYHGAVTYDGTTVKVYVNGVLENSSAIGLNTVIDGNGITIGHRAGGSYWTGQIDEPTLYDRALSDAEILSIYNAGSEGKCSVCIAPPQNMLAWWPGDGNANDIQGPTFENGAPINGATYAPGKIGQAFLFDGVDSYVRANNTTNIDGGAQATYDAWVYPTAAPEVGWYFAILGSGDSTFSSWLPQQCRLLYWRTASSPAGSARFYIDCGLDNNENYYSRMSASDYPMNTWHFVAGTFNNGALNIYVNGILDNGDTAGTGGTLINTAADNYVWIGAHVRNDGSTINVPFAGLIDEAEIFDRALTPTEIQAIYDAGTAGKCKTQVPQCSLTVSTTADGPAGSGSLRSAIICANTTPGADIITVPAGTYMFPLLGTNENASATGDLDITDSLTLNGAGPSTTILNGGQQDRVFDVIGDVSVSFNGLTITGGSATDCMPAPGLGSCGGAILSNSVMADPNDLPGTVEITNCVISNSTTTGGGADGGGIFNSGDSRTLTVTNSTLSGNTSGYGGAISGGGTITVTGSTITGNSAFNYGGGIYTGGPTTILNSTFSGNSAPGGGGAILSFVNLNISYSTFNGNAGGPAVYNWTGSTVITASILGYQQPGVPDCGGTITSNGHNLETGTSCGFTGPGDLQNTNPLLGPLQNNGGATFTHALLGGSPAIDAIPNGVNGCGTTVAVDQRSYSRPAGTGCDIGAFELNGQPSPTPTVSPTISPTPTIPQCITDPVVRNANDSGTDSLRQAVIDACWNSTITFDGNYAIVLQTGAIVIDKNLTIDGGTNVVSISGNNNGRIFVIGQQAGRGESPNGDGVSATLTSLSITSGSENAGGCIANYFGSALNIVRSSVTNCRTSSPRPAPTLVDVRPDSASVFVGGGAILNDVGGTVNITDSTISGNSTNGTPGGGILHLGGQMTITRSTISGNRTNGGDGGGIFVVEIATRPESPEVGIYPVLDVVNSTISGNSTEVLPPQMGESGSAGGIYAGFGSIVNLLNSTITNNSTPGRSGAGVRLDNIADRAENGDGAISKSGRNVEAQAGSVRNNIIAANGDSTDVRGAFVSTGYNLIGNVGAATGFGVIGDQVGTPNTPINPLLSPLGNYGGPTQTHPLLEGSPAVDKGGNAPDLTTDQRGTGFPRVVDNGGIPNAVEGNGSDIGAFELQTVATGLYADLAITKTDNRTSVTPGTQTTYTITVTNSGPDPAVDAIVTDNFPAGVIVDNWTCLPQNQAFCTLAGTGNIYDVVYLPVGGILTYTATVTINAGLTGTLVNTATVTPPPTVIDPSSGSCETGYDESTPPYNFVEINTTGTLIPFSDDQMSGAIPLGFSFSYFGVNYTDVYISSNGFLSVLPGQSQGCCSGQAIPGTDDPNGIIAAFWNDIYPPGAPPGGGVFYQTLGTPGNRVFIVEYKDNANCCNSTPAYTFQTKLFESTNAIEFHYSYTNNDGSQATAGIENQTGTVGNQFFIGEGDIADNTAVRYACSNNSSTDTDNIVISISGNVKEFVEGGPNVNLAGVTMTLNGGMPERPVGDPITATTDAAGNYTFTDVPSGGTWTVTPSMEDRVFDPTSRTLTGPTANVTGVDFVAYDWSNVPRNISILNTHAVPGELVTVPVRMLGQGTEKTMAFSIDYPSTSLNTPTVACGASTPGCTVTANISIMGKVGVTITAAAAVPAGLREIALVTFHSNAGAAQPNALLEFNDTPTARSLKDQVNNELPATYTNGYVVFTGGIESDVAVRSGGNGDVLATDITQVRRFVAGIDLIDPTYNEFQRADAAPAFTFGDGELSAGDVIQARRYSSRLDALRPAAGPTGPPLPPPDAPAKPLKEKAAEFAEATRTIRAGTVNAVPGQKVAVAVELEPFGNEVAAGFTLEFNPARLTNAKAALAGDASAAAVLTLNMNEAEDGRIGVLIDSTEPLARGSEVKPLVIITFDVAANAPGGETPIRFTDDLAKRGLSDELGNTLDARYTDGAVMISGPAAFGIEVSGRVTTANGQGLRNAQVTITDANGDARTVITGTFGYYRFEGIAPAAEYTLSVLSRRFRFAPRRVTMDDDLTSVNLIAQE